MVQNINHYNELPTYIDFLAFVKTIKISQDGYVISNKSHKLLSVNDHICWIIQEQSILAITRFLNTKAHKIIYYKKGVKSDIFNSTICKSFIKTYIKISNGEECLFEDIAKNITMKENEVTQLNTSIIPVEKSEIDFIFDNIPYIMKRGDIWNKSNVFLKRQFINKGDLIAILLDCSSKVYIENDTTFYEIIGEGKDPRFNQDFGPVNKAIRDNDKRILLFQSKNGSIRLLDEVFCIGYNIMTDNKCKQNIGRKIIIFKLCSLNKTVIHQEINPNNNVISQETILEEKMITTNNSIQERAVQYVDNKSKRTTNSFTNDIQIENREYIDMLEHLRKLYLTMSNLKDLGLTINDDIVNEINRLEEKIIKDELLPSITNKISDVLSSIERDLTLVINYKPNQPIKFSISRKHLTT